MWEDYSIGNGLANQITAVPNTNIISNYDYMRYAFASLGEKFSVPRNYKLLKRNRYLKLI